MKDEKFLKHLLSKRKELGPRSHRFSCLDITPAEKEKLYEIGAQAGLLTQYEFNGIKSVGTSHNDAACRVLDMTRQRAFSKLKAEFGAKAHFWVKPKQLCYPQVDFYWRKAQLGVVISGPLKDALHRGGPERIRDEHIEMLPTEQSRLSTITFPYYIVWHQPSEFIKKIRQKLIASGHYPRLGA
jgi:hypothetical protein